MNPKRPRRFGSAVSLALVVLALPGFGVGCGDSSGGGGHGDSDKFVGRWELDPDSGPFTFAGCQNAYANGDFTVWNELAFDYGELTDLTEVSGACVGVYQVGQNFFTVPGLPYDVSGDTATVPATDPYTGMASACLTIVDSDQGVYLRPKPNADWQFRLSSAASGEPRRAEFGVKAGGAPIVAEFVTPGENGLDVIDSCTLSGRATFFRVSHE